MSLFVHCRTEAWTESDNANLHKNAFLLMFPLVFIVIIIRINSFSLGADTIHYRNFKVLFFEHGNEHSLAVLLR